MIKRWHWVSRRTIQKHHLKPEHPIVIDEETTDDQKCTICFINKKIIVGNCGHTLCGLCSKHIYENTKPYCPICRDEWKDLRRFYY